MQVAKMLMAIIGAGLFAQASLGERHATTITNGSYQFESLQSAPTGATTAGSTAGSGGRTAGATAEIPEPESLFLLIVGLLGLSRLRGRPVKRKFPEVTRASRGNDVYSNER